MKIKFFTFLALGILVASCSKGDETAPIVTIVSPASNTTVSVTDTLLISAVVTDETKLAKITIKGLATDEVITSFDTPTSHAVNFNLLFGSTGTSIITIEAEDAEGNKGSAERTITVQ